MVTRVGRSAGILLLILVTAGTLTAENELSIDLSLYTSLMRLEDTGDLFDPDISLSALGKSVINIQSAGDKNVKAELELSALTLQSPAGINAFITVPRAYIKFRFPAFRLTAGRTRLSWGEGIFYNAGDLLFGSSGSAGNLINDVVRDETAWLVSSYHSIGRFTYLETVALIPEPGLAGTAPLFADTEAGARFETKLFNIRTQTGYVYRGTENTHSPFVSLQGNLWADWYAAVTTLLGPGMEAEKILDSTRISWGLFHTQSFRDGGSISFRLEGLVTPWGLVEETDTVRTPDMQNDPYVLMLYPEISWSPSRFLSFQARAIVSPFDGSALILPGAFWKPYRDFTILAVMNIQMGDENDIYGFHRDGGIGFTAGIRYIF